MKPEAKLIIDEDVAHTELARRVRERFPGHPIRVTRERGRFLRPCPGSPGMKCCNLFVLNPIVGCHYDCAYCFLQAYQSEPYITIYANIEDIAREVEACRAQNPEHTIRICTGELADSLALEPVAEAAAYLVELFRPLDGVQLELKTKSSHIDPLLALDHGGRTVISWSLNPPGIAAELENGTPGPEERLGAATRAAAAGYPVAFHFDPLIRRPDWKESYEQLVGDLFRAVPSRSMRWISLGGFRYTPAMKAVIRERFPASGLFTGEFVPCPDGKYRYFSMHRVEMYRAMRRWIERSGPGVPLYLCMEAPSIWQRVFGCQPEEIPRLAPIYDPCKDC
jgi:spore photoproduct lyase